MDKGSAEEEGRAFGEVAAKTLTHDEAREVIQGLSKTLYAVREHGSVASGARDTEKFLLSAIQGLASKVTGGLGEEGK
jgi:hypothetical protein